jgi:hypothetical protein
MINKTVLYINLNNTGLDGKCTAKIRDIFRTNRTLILLDIENNNYVGTHDNSGMALEDILYVHSRSVSGE